MLMIFDFNANFRLYCKYRDLNQIEKLMNEFWKNITIFWKIFRIQ